MNSDKSWTKPSDYLPNPYDLCRVQWDTGREQVVWWTGCAWEGSRKLRGQEVKLWQRHDNRHYFS